jgi:intracellular septation protein
MTKKAIVHFIIEFIPTFGFFIAAQYFSFYIATAILMGLAVISFIWGWLYERTIPMLPIIILVFVLVAGTITLYYQAPDALILSNSVYFLLFSTILYGGLLFQKNILEKIFANTFAITSRGWSILAVRWATLFLIVGLGNEYIRVYYDETVWVEYKLATTIAMSVFAILQFPLSRKYRLPEYSNTWGIRTKDTPQ